MKFSVVSRKGDKQYKPGFVVYVNGAVDAARIPTVYATEKEAQKAAKEYYEKNRPYVFIRSVWVMKEQVVSTVHEVVNAS